jgi:hypothetical protein
MATGKPARLHGVLSSWIMFVVGRESLIETRYHSTR